MTKADIVERVSKNTNFTKKDSINLVETVFEIIKETMERGENIKVHGFGNFTVRQKADRTGRNPQTGEAITITARKILTYKPSTLLKQAINN